MTWNGFIGDVNMIFPRWTIYLYLTIGPNILKDGINLEIGKGPVLPVTLSSECFFYLQLLCWPRHALEQIETMVRNILLIMFLIGNSTKRKRSTTLFPNKKCFLKAFPTIYLIAFIDGHLQGALRCTLHGEGQHQHLTQWSQAQLQYYVFSHQSARVTECLDGPLR